MAINVYFWIYLLFSKSHMWEECQSFILLQLLVKKITTNLYSEIGMSILLQTSFQRTQSFPHVAHCKWHSLPRVEKGLPTLIVHSKKTSYFFFKTRRNLRILVFPKNYDSKTVELLFQNGFYSFFTVIFTESTAW